MVPSNELCVPAKEVLLLCHFLFHPRLRLTLPSAPSSTPSSPITISLALTPPDGCRWRPPSNFTSLTSTRTLGLWLHQPSVPHPASAPGREDALAHFHVPKPKTPIWYALTVISIWNWNALGMKNNIHRLFSPGKSGLFITTIWYTCISNVCGWVCWLWSGPNNTYFALQCLNMRMKPQGQSRWQTYPVKIKCHRFRSSCQSNLNRRFCCQLSLTNKITSLQSFHTLPFSTYINGPKHRYYETTLSQRCFLEEKTNLLM